MGTHPRAATDAPVSGKPPPLRVEPAPGLQIRPQGAQPRKARARGPAAVVIGAERASTRSRALARTTAMGPTHTGKSGVPPRDPARGSPDPASEVLSLAAGGTPPGASKLGEEEKRGLAAAIPAAERAFAGLLMRRRVGRMGEVGGRGGGSSGATHVAR
ncbi:hypothetical protein C2845_PM06G23830 [Panicum miliaceum]|uniref:Uncharacterized protein n=1 Tax=Panicum miliaceum TaxID=4540 RepID=A0A3L6RBK6_PANMI|nr:hypothetical protein C2845_PM06G23830 [Panicum miliaceum]